MFLLLTVLAVTVTSKRLAGALLRVEQLHARS